MWVIGNPWRSSGWDSVFPLLKAQVQSHHMDKKKLKIKKLN